MQLGVVLSGRRSIITLILRANTISLCGSLCVSAYVLCTVCVCVCEGGAAPLDNEQTLLENEQTQQRHGNKTRSAPLGPPTESRPAYLRPARSYPVQSSPTVYSSSLAVKLFGFTSAAASCLGRFPPFCFLFFFFGKDADCALMSTAPRG